MLKPILFSAFFLNIGLLLGRLSGFVRESFVAATYGTSSQADAVAIMLTVPDLLANILVGGAMGAVLVPEFKSNLDRSKKILFQAMVFFGVVFTLISVVLHWQSYLLVELLAPGLKGGQALQASAGLGWVVWLLPLTALASITTAYLHFQNKFFVASLGTLVINITIISGLVLANINTGSIFWVAMFILLGGALRLLSQLAPIGIGWQPLKSFKPLFLNNDVLRRYLQALTSGGIVIFIPVLARAFASYQGEGKIAIMNYALKLIEFPLTILITIFTIVLFPRLTDSFTADKQLYKRLIIYGLQIILGVSILSAIALILLSEHYVSIVFGYGRMQTEGLLIIRELTSTGLLLLPIQGVSLFLMTAFYSQKDTRTPLIISVAGLLGFVLVANTGIFGNDLESIVISMLFGYSLIVLLQLYLFKADDLKIKKIFLRGEFIAGILTSSLMLYLLVLWINSAKFNSIITILIAALAGVISVITLALFSHEVRRWTKKNVL